MLWNAASRGTHSKSQGESVIFKFKPAGFILINHLSFVLITRFLKSALIFKKGIVHTRDLSNLLFSLRAKDTEQGEVASIKAGCSYLPGLSYTYYSTPKNEFPSSSFMNKKDVRLIKEQ